MAQRRTAQDDRGRDVPVLAPDQVLAASGADDPELKALARTFRDAVRAERIRVNPVRVAIGVAVVGGMIALGVALRVWMPGSPPLISTALFWGGVLSLVVLFRFMARRKIRSGLAATAVAHGLCGRCGYALRDLSPEADGCVVCPECGGAWKRFRLTKTFWTAGSRDRPPAPGGLLNGFRVGHRRFFFVAPDDRGVFTVVPDSRLRRLIPGRGDAIGQRRRCGLVRKMRRSGRVWRAVMSFLPLFVGVLVPIGLAVDVSEGRLDWTSPATLIGLGFAALFLFLAVAVNRSEQSVRRGAVARILVGDGLCGSCVAALDTELRDKDGCTVCARCGSAWRGATPGSPVQGTPPFGDGCRRPVSP